MAFKQMKTLISEFPILTASKEKEEMVIYLAATKEAIRLVLMMERDGKQMPIYFVSRVLQGPEINYTPMEKSMLALRFELEEHDIHYRLRTSVKGQILADFIMERPEDDPLDTPIEDNKELPDPWILFTNESSCIDGSGAGLIITNPEGVEFTYALRFRFDATNNEAEYEDLIAGLWIAEQMGVKILQENVNSRLLANQVNGTYIAKEPGMIKYLEKVKALTSTFKEFSIKQANYVLREIHEGSCSMHAGLSNGETPFSLTYGTKAVIPVEIGMPTLRTAKVDMNNEASHAEDGGKLGPKWEGPYEVTKALGKGAYKLRDCNGNILP
uniref:Reverse transcriptase domain-containing protein n=1 Tax=Tanacetum cinerariifolium TaxID=118510 RepID=A0A6L2MNA7_TANCI|nr:reverse transcriptase domain-containing protein [Tanacetum cinerariifolium]